MTTKRCVRPIATMLLLLTAALPACGSCARDKKDGEGDPAAESTEPAGSGRHVRMGWDGGRHRFRRIGQRVDGGSDGPAGSASGEAPPP